MSQTASVVVQNSPRVGTYQGGMNMSQPNPILQQRETTRSPQTSSASEPTFTALPVHPSREPRLPSASTQPPVPYQGPVSHHTQASVSSHISHESFSHRRRGSTLKTVMRKIFGIKRQSILEGDETDEDSSMRIERSRRIAGAPDPISIGKARSRNSNTSPSAANQQRSLAVSRLSSTSSDGLAQDTKFDLPYTVRRRATLPSLVLSDDEGITKERTLSVISPVSTRPVSAMSTVSAITGRDHGDTESLHTQRVHRRSRSADDLQAIIRRHRMSPIQWRRRSKETKDWRSSGLEPDDQEDAAYIDHDIANPLEHEIDPPRDNKMPVADEEDATRSTEVESPPIQVQSLIANMADPDASVDQRLATIEVKLMDLEFAIAKMQGSGGNDRLTKTAESTPEKAILTTQNIAAYRDQLCAASETSSDSASFGGNGRPISTSTLRPSMVLAQSPPWQAGSSSNLHGISIEQYSALVTLLRREQTARKSLESQVQLLQEEMQSLRRSSGLPASPPGTLYPIPSPDSDDGRYRRRRNTSSSRKDSGASDTKNSEPQQWGSPYTRSRSNTGKRTSSRTTAANMI